MGIESKIDGNEITIRPPEYRNDFLHPVDVVEDVMIGRGMNSFQPVMPTDFTVGRYTPEEEFAREVKDIMVGLGFQEMVYNYLGSGKEFIDNMNIDGGEIVRIANPLSENYEFVRASILPCLLASESVSGNAVYPHNIFEVGKIAHLNRDENYGSSTRNYLGFLTADKQAGFTLISSHMSALFFYLNTEYRLEELEDPRFIKGRAAEIIYDRDRVGVFGEIHPAVLENWGITMPCTAGEIDLDFLVRR
jgi:phenylalanyl-tRNA synthetase beta chain